jgi:hypothetical protein
VYRCACDGSGLQAIVKRDQADCDVMSWCVGIAVFPSRGKFYWTQKGPSKGGKGRMFYADISRLVGDSRSDITCILDNLPESIDLHINEKNDKLYWTDRGEIPHGNSLNSISLDAAGIAVKDSTLGPRPQILCRQFKKAIKLALNSENDGIFITDLKKFVYYYNITNKQKHMIYKNKHQTFTGIVLV